MKSIFLALMLAPLWAQAGSAPPSQAAGHQPGEEAAVLAAMDRYLTTISASDLKTQDAMQMPGSMTWRDGTTSHCGVDVFDFVKVDGTWRVANGMWTVEPEACAELRPSDPSQIRPAD